MASPYFIAVDELLFVPALDKGRGVEIVACGQFGQHQGTQVCGERVEGGLLACRSGEFSRGDELAPALLSLAGIQDGAEFRDERQCCSVLYDVQELQAARAGREDMGVGWSARRDVCELVRRDAQQQVGQQAADTSGGIAPRGGPLNPFA